MFRFVLPRSLRLGRAFLTLAVFAVALASAGCDKSEPRLRPLSADAVVLAFGDSLTFGSGANEEEAYPHVLQGLIGKTVINAGIPGEISRDGLRRLPGVLQQHSPQLLILCHGGNDIIRRLNKQQTRSNIVEMIKSARERGVQVVMLGVPKFGFMLNTAPVYLEIAQEFDVPIDADILPTLLSDNEFKSDRVHPNAGGYSRMAYAVHELLKANGAVPQ